MRSSSIGTLLVLVVASGCSGGSSRGGFLASASTATTTPAATSIATTNDRKPATVVAPPSVVTPASTKPNATKPTPTTPTATTPASPTPTATTTPATAPPKTTTPKPTTPKPTTSTPTATTPPATPAPAPRPTSKAGYVQIAPSGTGFYSYSPASRRWGTPRLIYGMERVARRWATERPAGTNARIGFGDASFENGGKISGHVSHQKGVDVDVRLARADGKEEATTYKLASYSRAGTQKLVDLFRGELTVTNLFFNDPKVTRVSKWPNHDNHLHVRIK